MRATSNGTLSKRGHSSDHADNKVVEDVHKGRPYPLGATISEEQVHLIGLNFI